MIGFLCGVIGFLLGILDENFWVKHFRGEADHYRTLWHEGLDARNELCERVLQLEYELAGINQAKKQKAAKTRKQNKRFADQDPYTLRGLQQVEKKRAKKAARRRTKK